MCKTKLQDGIFKLIAGLVCLFILASCQKTKAPAHDNVTLPKLSEESEPTNFFSLDYPASKKFQDELTLMRQQGKIEAENEIVIHRTIAEVAQRMDIPRALLWCLLFQESRLNHLLGLRENTGIHGIGQFSHFGFYEINKQTNRYDAGSLSLMRSLLGKDVRPIRAMKSNINHPSSYYSIPTAVTASAMYLNNRYAHLQKLLEKRKLNYNNDLLWLYAAMAYNKGTRSVLSLWNQAQQSKGYFKVDKIVNEPNAFFNFVQNKKITDRALSKIWRRKFAKSFAKELRIHIRNIRSCSMANNQAVES